MVNVIIVMQITFLWAKGNDWRNWIEEERGRCVPLFKMGPIVLLSTATEGARPSLAHQQMALRRGFFIFKNFVGERFINRSGTSLQFSGPEDLMSLQRACNQSLALFGVLARDQVHGCLWYELGTRIDSVLPSKLLELPKPNHQIKYAPTKFINVWSTHDKDMHHNLEH